MKFKTFMKILFAGFVLLLGGTCYGCYHLVSSRQQDPVPTRTDSETTMVTPNPTPTSAVQQGPGALRPFDQKILDKAGQKISGDKVKDALPGQVKVNLYQDKPGQGVNRAKLDLDRDDKFDEKWTFEKDGDSWKVKRQVSPQDNENYTEEYRLREGRWVAK